MSTAISSGDMKRAAIALEAKPMGDGSREVSLSFSSEEPYLRVDGWEILGHGHGEVDLARLNTGQAPLLKDHLATTDAMVGKVIAAQVAGGRGEAVVRFSETPEGDKMLARVKAGEVTSVSVGYAFRERAHVDERNGLPVFRVTRWVPKEISLVAVPADATVGVGRSGTDENLHFMTIKEAFMPTTLTAAKPGETATSAKDERTRCAEISATGRHFELPGEMIQRAIEDGTDVDTFRRQTLEEMSKRSATVTHTNPSLGITAKLSAPDFVRADERPYSLTRAINAHLSRDWSEAGFEREVGQEMRNYMGRSAQGIFVPEVALAQRSLLTTTNAPSLIGTQQAGNMFIDALRPETQVMNLGATVMPGLRQNVSIPRMPMGTAAAWISEDDEASESTPSFDSVTLSMRQLSAHTRMSRRQLKQSVPGLDNILRNDLRRQIAVAVDLAAISGAGSALEPQGILGLSGIGNVPLGADGDSLSWPKVAALMAEVDGANLGVQAMGFLSNAKVKGALMSIPTVAHGHTSALESSDGKFRLGGAPALFSNNVPNNLTKGTGTNLSALIYGAWSELIIGMWGGVDIITDDVTEATKGNVRIVAHSEWDVAVRNAEAFAAITDIVTE